MSVVNSGAINQPNSSNAATCPICGQANHCAMLHMTNIAQNRCEHCWCSSVQFSPKLFDRLSKESINKACICQDCAHKSHQQDKTETA